MSLWEVIGYAIPTIIVGATLVSGIRIIRPTERAIVETFGKYSRFLNPGITWIIPFVQQSYHRDITERMTDVERQEVITNDNLNTSVDAQVYYKVRGDEESFKKSFYKADDFENQLINLTRTTLRDVIGSKKFVTVNSNRNTLNDLIAKKIKPQINAWGAELIRVELMQIDPPQDVQSTMNEVIKAENEKIAAKDRATAMETEADGEKRADIKRAEGQKSADILVAEGKAKAVQLVHVAANKYFRGNAQKLKKYEVTQKSLEDNSKIVLTQKGIDPVLIMDGGADRKNVVPVKKK